MPDLTLYADDVERICSALKIARQSIYSNATCTIVSEDEYEEIQNLQALHDKMRDRQAQNLHPNRKE